MINMDKVTAAWVAEQAEGALGWLAGYCDPDDEIGGQARITPMVGGTWKVTDSGQRYEEGKRFRIRVEVDELVYRCVNDTDGDGDCSACVRNPEAPCLQWVPVDTPPAPNVSRVPDGFDVDRASEDAQWEAHRDGRDCGWTPCRECGR